MVVIIATVCMAASLHCSGGIPKATVDTQVISSEGCTPPWDGRANGVIDVTSCLTPYTIVWRSDGEELIRRQIDPRPRTSDSAESMIVSAAI